MYRYNGIHNFACILYKFKTIKDLLSHSLKTIALPDSATKDWSEYNITLYTRTEKHKTCAIIGKPFLPFNIKAKINMKTEGNLKNKINIIKVYRKNDNI